MKRIERRGQSTGRAAHRGVLAGRMIGIPMKFGERAEICGQGEPADFVYEVVNGAVRTVKVLTDGRRKVGGFYFAGDIFGLEDGKEHSLSAEAIVASTVRVIKRRRLVRLAAYDRKLAEALLTMSIRETARAQRHALMLIMSAQERVNSFLVEMGQRISVGDMVRLPMSRQDIADHLGLTIETVSRTMTGLADAATIDLPSSRAVMLRNRSALEQGAGAEAGTVV